MKEAGLCYTTYVCTHMRMTGSPVWIPVSTMPTARCPCLHLVPDLLSFHVHKTCLTVPAYHITESEQCIYKVICLAIKHHNHGPTAQTTTTQSLQYYEHLSEPMAECLHILLREFDHAQLGDEILHKIAAKSFSAQDTKGPDTSLDSSCSSWSGRHAVLKQINLLLSQLNSICLNLSPPAHKAHPMQHTAPQS